MEKTYGEGYIDSFEESKKSEAKIRQDIKELKEKRERKEKARIRNLKIRRINMAKFLAKVVVAGGMVLLVATKTDDAINAIIDWDNANIEREYEDTMNKAEELTGKTREELLGEPAPDYDKLREEAKEAEKTDLDRAIEEYLDQMNEENLQDEYEQKLTEYDEMLLDYYEQQSEEKSGPTK